MNILSNKKALRSSMPQGTLALFLIQVVSTLSFSVLYSTLVLYMKGPLGMSFTTANTIMGVFIAFNFGLHLLGGFWGGRLFSYRALFCFGMVSQMIGCVLLSMGSVSFLYYGLAAFLTGSGLNVTCVNCMLTQRFAPDDTQRESAFLWNYAGMNIGFFVGFSLSGIFQLTQDYQQLFLFSSLGNVVALLICLACWKQLDDIDTAYSKKDKSLQKKSTALGLVFILLMPFILSYVVQHAQWANKLVLLTGGFMVLLILLLARIQGTKEAKGKLVAFAVFMIFSTIFWMLYQIGPMGLTLFIDNNVQREYWQWIIPPQWFQNINTLAIVLGGPLLAYAFNKMRTNGIEVNLPTQFAMSLLLIGLAFILLPMGIACANADGMVHPSWVVVSFILQSAGELLISPVGYAMIGFLAPPSLQGLLMGMWMLNTGVGAVLSSYSSNLMTVGTHSSLPLLTNPGYSHIFLWLGLFGIASACILFIWVPKLKELIREKNHNAAVKDSSVIVSKRVVLCE